MSENGTTLPRLGIIGGGQLGKMLAQAAKTLGISVAVLDPDADAPAMSLADHVVLGGYQDPEAYAALAKCADVITYEREDIDDELLQSLVDAGCRVYPDPSILATIQDKYRQKQFLQTHGISTSRFEQCDVASADQFSAFGYPLVQKVRQGGYDGRGVQVISDASQIDLALAAPSLIEDCVDIEMELGIMVARSADGEVRSYPVVDMNMKPGANVLDTLVVPARLSDAHSRQAIELAERTISALGLVGVLAIELFLDRSGHLMVNEISSRPHNLGHYTIEACQTSQYEQHLRAIMGLPLGSTELLSPAVMVNVLGDAPSGDSRISGLTEVMGISGVSVHLYGKQQVSPGRKMGHVVILDASIESALEKADQVKQTLKISGG